VSITEARESLQTLISTLSVYFLKNQKIGINCMASNIKNQQNNKQDKLTSDISFELERAKKKLQADEKLTYLNLSNHNIGSSIKLLNKTLEKNKTVTHINFTIIILMMREQR
jgi:hypothetical protein